MIIDSHDALRALYGAAMERAVRKQPAALDGHCLRFVGLPPFVVLSSAGAAGPLDASPRGGEPGVHGARGRRDAAGQWHGAADDRAHAARTLRGRLAPAESREQMLARYAADL